MGNVVRERAVKQIYRFLVKKAQDRQTTYYEEIAMKFEHLGLHTSGSALGACLSPILDDIFKWCQKRGQPPLTSLVVRKSGADVGFPGRGFWTALGMPHHHNLNTREKQTLVDAFQKQVFEYYEMC